MFGLDCVGGGGRDTGLRAPRRPDMPWGTPSLFVFSRSWDKAAGASDCPLSYILTPRCRVLLEQLTGLQLVKKFPRISRNPKVHYRTHKRPPTISILGQPNPVHIPTSHLLESRPNIIHPSTSYLLTPWCRVLFEKLTGLQLVKKFPRISRNPKVNYRTHKSPPPVSGHLGTEMFQMGINKRFFFLFPQ
jgi:hypothetical protein